MIIKNKEVGKPGNHLRLEGTMYKILVVDNEEAIQILYADELTEEGYEVIAIGDGSQVMRLIEQRSPDLIVLAVRLGKYDGLDLLQDIRNTYYNIPVVLCSAYPHFRYDPRSIAADYYVLKSSDLRELKQKVRMALEGCLHILGRTTAGNVKQMVTPSQGAF
jgi:DNA-binding response OmpR family regulator